MCALLKTRATGRRGFTLIELVTAITLSAIVLAIAGSALMAATHAQTVIERNQRTIDAESRWRLRLSDMLRHAPRPDAVDEPMLQISPGSRAAPTLTFLSQGVTQPYGVGRIWRVTLTNGAHGVMLDAEAIGRGPRMTRLHSELTHLMVTDIEVLEAGISSTVDGAASSIDHERGEWRIDWPIERSRPAFLRLRFASSNSVGNSTSNRAGNANDTLASMSTNGLARVAFAPLIVDLSPVSFNAR